MSEQEKGLQDTFDANDEEGPDVEAHLQDTFSREDAFDDRHQTDSADERHRVDEAI